MTGNTGEKVRAVFLAFLMVMSVFGMTAGLAGSAAADASNLTVDDGTPAQPDGTVTVSVDVGEPGNESSFLIEDSAESVADFGTITDGGDGDVDGAEDGVVTADLDLAGNFGGANPADGTATVYASEGTSVTTNDAEETATFVVDGTAPEFGYSQPEGTVTTTTPEIIQNISDDLSGVDEETVQVTLRDGDGVYYTYTIDPTEDNDGVEYADGNLTVQPGTGDVPELEDHSSYTVEVSASDNAGNGPATTSFGFDVDTDAHAIQPQFTFERPGETVVTEPEQIIEVSVETADSESTATAIENANITISNETDDYFHTFEETDTSVWSEDASGNGTFSVDASEGGDIPALPNGVITVQVNATNDQDNYNQETFTFEVADDNTQPNAVDVSLSDDEIYEGNNAGEETVTVTFDEPVDSVVVEARDGGTTATITQTSASSDHHATEVELQFDVTDLGETTNESAVVEVIEATDQQGNGLNQTANTTFAIDTELSAPSIGTVGDANVLSGYVNFTEDVTPSQDDDVESTNYYLLKGGNGAYDPADDREDLYELETPSHTDTRELSEGRHTFVVYSTDDAGNEEFDTQKVTIDNWDVVSEFSDDMEEPLTGEVDVTEAFTVYNTGTEEPTYYYAKNPTNPDDQSQYVQADSFEVEEDATYYLAAEVPDPGYEGDPNDVFQRTGALDAQALDVTEFTVETDQDTGTSTASHQGTFTVNVTTDMPLDSLHVDYVTADNYVQQDEGHFHLEDFEQVESDSGYTYTMTVDAPRDGAFDFVVKEASSGDLELGYRPSQYAEMDASDPALVDADLVDAGEDYMAVELTFDEPVQGVASAEDFNGAEIIDGQGNLPEGVVTVYLSDEVQTGDETQLVLNGVTEQFGDGSSDVSEDVTFGLELEAGTNVVSLPAETGSVELVGSEFDQAAVEAVWAYDAAEEEWISFVPGASENDLTALEGGEGYIVVVDDGAVSTASAHGGDTLSIDVNVENVPLEDRQALQQQRVHEGWNLVGHYQEGHQSTGQALAPLGDRTYSIQLGYTGMQVEDLRPGEGYWLFVDDSGYHVPVPYEGMSSEQPDVYNVEVTDDDGDGIASSGEAVHISAEVDAPNRIDQVRADHWGIGVEGVELTDDDGDGVYEATTTLEDGVETDAYVEVTAIDAYGNTDEDGDVVTVDTAAPAVSNYRITNDDPTNSQQVEVAFDTDEQLDSVSASVTGAEIGTLAGSDFSEQDNGDGTFTYTATYDGSSDGDYTITLDTATDAVQNDGASGETDTVTVDTTSPSTQDATITSTSSEGDADTYLAGEDIDIDVSYDEPVYVENQSNIGLDLTVAGNNREADLTAGDGTDTLTFTYTVQPDDGEGEVTIGNIMLGADGSIQDEAGNDADLTSSDHSVTAWVDTTSPTISSTTLDNDGSDNLALSFDSDEQLDTITVNVDGPNTQPAYTFDETDFAESANSDGSYTYTLDTTQAYDDGDGDYTAYVDDATDAAGNNGGNNGDGNGHSDTYSHTTL